MTSGVQEDFKSGSSARNKSGMPANPKITHAKDLWLRPILADGTLDALIAKLSSVGSKSGSKRNKMTAKILELLT